MKTQFLLLPFFLLIIISPVMKDEYNPSIKNLHKNFVPITEESNIWICRFEEPNWAYNEFLDQITYAPVHKACMYDSSQWVKKITGFNQPMESHYHWHPSYDDHPVVNITKYGMQQYCEWLTETYNEDRRRKYERVVFRLPTLEEYKTLFQSAKEENIEYWKENGEIFEIIDDKYLANMRYRRPGPSSDHAADGHLYTTQINALQQTKNKVYSIIGNVAEVTVEGKVVGGDWGSIYNELENVFDRKYEIPDPRVGFRIVMEIIEE